MPALPRNSWAPATRRSARLFRGTTQRAAAGRTFDADAARTQRIQHAVDVVGVERLSRFVVPSCERREQRRAIGDAFEPGNLTVPCALAAGASVKATGNTVPIVMRRRRRWKAASPPALPRRRRPLEQSRQRRLRRLDRSFGRRWRAHRDTAPIRSCSASRFASAMSRHISGEPAAMRVKSRKPPPACANSASPSGRRASSSTSANASTCGRCDTAANTRSCRAGVIVVTARAAGFPKAHSSLRGALSAVSMSGVSTTLRPANSDARAAAAPDASLPAIGCPGTKATTGAHRMSRGPRRRHPASCCPHRKRRSLCRSRAR